MALKQAKMAKMERRVFTRLIDHVFTRLSTRKNVKIRISRRVKTSLCTRFFFGLIKSKLAKLVVTD